MASSSSPPARRRTPRNLAHRWSRSLHSWTSMVSLLLVLFFALTGLTANHPDWAGPGRSATVTGVLPDAARSGSEWDLLAVSEFVRATHDVSGTVTDHGVESGQGRLAYQGPGYEAALFFDADTGSYTMTTTSYGLLGVINDLHKGRHTLGFWSVVIDASAVILVAVSLTGLVLQLLIERRRRTALVLLGLGVAAGGALLALAWH